MHEVIRRIISVLVPTLLLSAVCGVANAQVDASALMRAQRNGQNITGGYGQNPYENPEEQNGEGENKGEQADSTKKRERKPLESYFFNDSIRALRNFQWNIDRDYNKVDIHPLDTTLTAWRIDYPHYRERLGNNSVGGLGPVSYTHLRAHETSRSADWDRLRRR